MKIVGICGEAGAGKDTLGEILGGEIISFAGPLKDVCSFVFDIPHEEFITQEGKARCHDNGFGFTNRRLLQIVGTEMFRKLIHNDVWIEKFKREVSHYEYVVVTDIRFDNEAEIIKGMGGLILEIVRPNNPIETEEHLSEVGISKELISATIVNDGTIKDLVTKLNQLGE